eukprot:Lankesteria_metandrocarpae@DN1688_c0_g1_i1.p1
MASAGSGRGASGGASSYYSIFHELGISMEDDDDKCIDEHKADNRMTTEAAAYLNDLTGGNRSSGSVIGEEGRSQPQHNIRTTVYNRSSTTYNESQNVVGDNDTSSSDTRRHVMAAQRSDRHPGDDYFFPDS